MTTPTTRTPRPVDAPRVGWWDRRRAAASDAGYVLALTALLILPLMAFAGLAVDLGSWYSRGTAIQRVTDAASLAGAGSLASGVANAQSVAIQVAAQNGFVNGVDGITVSAAYVEPDQMRVTITDTSVPQYLTSVFRPNVSVSRTSLAEYVPPVKMGSPRNYLGTGGLSPGGGLPTDNFWLAISSPCSSKENGDRIQTVSDANFNTGSNPRAVGSGVSYSSCTGGSSITNTEYDPNGYFYAVRFESNYSGQVAIEVYDAAFCSGSGYVDQQNSGSSFTTTYRMRSNNSADPTQATPIGTPIVVGSSSTDCSTYRNQWRTLHTLNNPTRGTYFIQVTSSNAASTSNQGGSNSFALRAREGGTFSPCTTETGATGFRANCPNVFALENLGVAATIGGSQPSWYLADIGPEHSGKTMEIALWDPGEGSVALEILNPLGTPVNFRWRVLCGPGDTPPTGGCGPGNTSILDLVGNTEGGNERNPQPGLRRASLSKYSDRLLLLEVELPDNITTAYGGRTWWRIRYTSGSAPTDRTTWGVTIKGDPVRLVE